jgi:hypothetical protein
MNRYGRPQITEIAAKSIQPRVVIAGILPIGRRRDAKLIA